MNARHAHALIVAIALAAFALASQVRADGGAVVDRGRYGPFDVTVFVAPVPVTEGRADLSILIAHDGTPRIDLPVRIRAVDPEGRVSESTLGDGDGSNQLLRAGVLTLDSPGEWTVSIQIADRSDATGTFTLTVAPAPPHWRTLLPWMLLWIPIALLMVVRERLVVEGGL